MADQEILPTESTPATSSQQPAKQAENMVPQSRFNEVNEERRKMAERIAQMESEQKAEIEKRLVEQNQYKELAEARGVDLVKAQAEAAKVATYEKTLLDVLNAQVAALPEDKRGLLPDELTTAQKLSWLAKNSAILKAPTPFDIGAGKQGGGEQKQTNALSPEEVQIAKNFGMTPEEYSKHK